MSAVTSITIKSGNQVTKLVGHILIADTSDTDAKIKLLNLTYTQLLFNVDKLLKSPPLYPVKKINQARPTDGNIFLLGQRCISVITEADKDASLFLDVLPGSSLVLFDGCKSCLPDCQQIVNLFHDIRDFQVWINSLKDICLYSEPTCSLLYLNLYKTSQYNTLPSTLNCLISSVPKRDLWLYGIRLLYQYKALVALWNYLADSKARITQISTALLDYAGINVVWRYTIDLCLFSGSPTSNGWRKIGLKFDTIIQDPQQDLPKKKSGLVSGKFALFFMLDSTNTYIKYKQDLKLSLNLSSNDLLITASDKVASTLKLYIDVKLTDKVYKSELKTTAQIQDASILFGVSNILSGILLLSVAAKIIPVWVPWSLALHINLLSLYLRLRQNNTLIPESTGNNVWNVAYLWYNPVTEQLISSDVLVYRTPRTRVPSVLKLSLLG